MSGGSLRTWRVGLAALALFVITTRGLTVADAALHLDVAVGLIEREGRALSFDPGDLTVTRAPLAGGLFHFTDDGAVESSLPPGLSFVALPFVGIGSLLAKDEPPIAERIQPIFIPQGELTYRALVRPLARDPRTIAFTLIAPLAGALACAFVFLALLGLEVSARARYAAVIALALSPLGVYAGTCWTQSVTAAALAFGGWWIVRLIQERTSSTWPLGLALGIAILVRPDHGVFAVPFVAAALHASRDRGLAQWLGLGVAPALAYLALAAWGRPESGGGWDLATLPLGASGLLVSPLSGLLVYAPFTLVACFAGRSLAAPLRWLALVPLAMLVVYGGWFDWDASLAYGPRFFVPALPLFAIGFGLAFERMRAAAIATIVVGAAMAIPGLLLAHARIPESHEWARPVFLDAWEVLLERGEDAIGAGVDCVSTYLAVYAWIALACVLLGLAVEVQLRRVR